MTRTHSQKSMSALPWIIAVGAVKFAIGAVGAFAFSQANQSRQNYAIAMLAAQLADMQVTRAQSLDLLAITTPAAAFAPSTAIPSASAVLAARIPTSAPDARPQADKIAQAIAIVNRNKMRMLTEGVVAGQYTVTADAADGQGTRIALNSINAASVANELESILSQAAANGDIDVPGSVSASGGAIDSKTLLFDLVQRRLEDGSEKEIDAAEEMSRWAFEASAAKTQLVNGQRYYTVEQGGSLAYISLQFYAAPMNNKQSSKRTAALSRAPTEFRSVSGWLSPKHKAATLLVAGLTGPAQAAELNFCWKGAGSYSMTGRMSLPDAAMFKTILTEDDISGFKISGYHKGSLLGTWDSAQRGPDATWHLRFDPAGMLFLTGGSQALHHKAGTRTTTLPIAARRALALILATLAKIFAQTGLTSKTAASHPTHHLSPHWIRSRQIAAIPPP